jgi:hypothetical protein
MAEAKPNIELREKRKRSCFATSFQLGKPVGPVVDWKANPRHTRSTLKKSPSKG